jgi:isopentenyl-diphosphate Delta-isomerase
MSEQVVLVDAEDRPLGEMGKLDAHRRNLRHRAISVLVFDDADRMLLQRRSAGKYHSAGLWSNACCSHPRPGEPAADAAMRRLEEELGFSCPLSPVGRVSYEADVGNGLYENEVVHVFVGRHTGEVVPNRAEVSAVDWRPVAEIRSDMGERAAQYTAWFRLYAGAPWFEAPAPTR